MNNYQLGLYEKSMPHRLSIIEKLTIAKQSGFEFLEISIDETDEKLSRLSWNTDKCKELQLASLDLNIPIGSMCLSGHRKYPLGSLSEQTRKKSLEIMQRALYLACLLGVRVIQLAGYDVYYEQSNEKTEAYFRENLEKCVEMAAMHGVMLAFETMETPFMDTVGKAMKYVSEINSPYLQIYPDFGNLTNASLVHGHDVIEDLNLGAGHIVAMHLKETTPGKYRDIPYGTGHVEFALGIASSMQMGIRRFVGEFWDNGNFMSQISHAHDFLRRNFELSAN